MRWHLKSLALAFLSLVILSSCQQISSDNSNEEGSLVSNVGRAVFSLTSETFNCQAFIESVKDLPVLHIAVLYNTFGNNYSCWDVLADDPRLQTVELNLINEPGHRNARLGDYEFLFGLGTPANYDRLLREKNSDLKVKFENYVQLAKSKINDLPGNVECLINPGLESNVSPEAGSTLIEWTKEQFPRCRTVWNPLVGGDEASRTATQADLVEAHGPLPQVQTSCIVNLDGTDIDFPSRPSTMERGNYVQSGAPLTQYVATYANQCEVVFLWVLEDNCNYSSRFVDPRSRDCNAAASVFPLVAAEANKAMNSIRQYNPRVWSEEENISLNGCTEIRSPNDGNKAGFLLKQSEFRERGGVVIFPREIRASGVEVLSNGNVIDSYNSSGTYDHDFSNRPMWRSLISPTTYPFHVVVKATTATGSVCYPIDNPNARND